MPICARARYPSGVLYDNHALFRLRTKTRRSRGLLSGRGIFRSGGDGIRRDRRHSHSRSSMHALRIMPPCPQLPYCHTHAYASAQSPSPWHLSRCRRRHPVHVDNSPSCLSSSVFVQRRGRHACGSGPAFYQGRIPQTRYLHANVRVGPRGSRPPSPRRRRLVCARPPPDHRRVVRRRVNLLRTFVFAMSIVLRIGFLFFLFRRVAGRGF